MGADVQRFDRITFDPHVMGGRACIRGMRITVALVVGLVADGMGIDEIIDAYPYLDYEDISQALRYAAWLDDESVHPPEPTTIWNFLLTGVIASVSDRSVRLRKLPL